MLTKLRSYLRQLSVADVISTEEIEGVLRLPVLAVIPHLERRQLQSVEHQHQRRQINLDGRWFSRLLIHFPADIPAARVYEDLVLELKKGADENRRKVLVLTSPMSGEGASLTAVNLAIAGQRKGIRVLVVEGDLRSPRISSVLKVELEPGLTGVLTKRAPVVAAIQRSTVAPIDVLPAGRALAYPGSLWDDPAFQRLLIELRGMYDLVLYDTGSLLLYPDSAGVAAHADGIVLVHQFGRGSQDRIQRAVGKLGKTKESILGVVMNDVPDGWSESTV